MKKFVTNLQAVAEALGLTAKLADKGLSQEEQMAIVAEYNKRHGENSFEADKKEYDAEVKAAEEAAALSGTFASVAEQLGVSAAEAKTPEGQAKVLEAINELKSAGVDVLGWVSRKPPSWLP